MCERPIRLSDEAGTASHPAALHLHIHLLEMSTQPELGMRSAERRARCDVPYEGPAGISGRAGLPMP
ncbi:hypothetical protein [Mesorhizobium sp. B4-1-3]|uniref:hypothetical protein n=1 Tax=Mesorhizobium sp. B4-1-3 TaxID=2589889 RepID=UPI0032B22178